MKTIVLPMLALGACAMTAEGTPPAGEGGCDAAKAADLVGQVGTSELGAKALKATGARALRWTRPGMAVTMDYREDRLNIHLDAQDKVERITCG